MRTLVIVTSVLLIAAASVTAAVTLRETEPTPAAPDVSLRMDAVEQRLLDIRERDAEWKQERAEAAFLRQHEALRREARTPSR